MVCPYDNDQLFPVFGFGGFFPKFAYLFPLNANFHNPSVSGEQGILEEYRSAIMKYGLAGPTTFSPIISYVEKIAISGYKESNTYTILVILTDGIIDDMGKTIDSIVEACESPLSIIIIGVGRAKF